MGYVDQFMFILTYFSIPTKVRSYFVFTTILLLLDSNENPNVIISLIYILRIEQANLRDGIPQPALFRVKECER